ncbi:hypothetical protein J3Q64DRAFT_1448916 [Phycomyces blakesleeanus]|uniref:Uncharacterized protein n=1 Tax=Phycomyces blakesleeanus TaxID=4837 RepID=A0ABR3AGC3_PHYBL
MSEGYSVVYGSESNSYPLPIKQEYEHNNGSNYGPVYPATGRSLAADTPSSSANTPTADVVTPVGSPTGQKRHSLDGLTPRAYLDATVVPVLLEGMKQLATERPADPLTWLGNYLTTRASTDRNQQTRNTTT